MSTRPSRTMSVSVSDGEPERNVVVDTYRQE